MENNIYRYDGIEERSSSLTLPALMSKVYLWMTLALLTTGLTAYYVATNESIIYTIINNPGILFGLFIAELALVIFLSARITKMSFATAGITFAAYSVLNGATFSLILLAYTAESIATTFLVTAGTFGAMSLFGMFTKKNLSAMGRFLFMALIGLIIATIVNIFVASTAFSWILTYAGVLIFCGLTAYDTQRMKEMLMTMENEGNSNMLKMALMCSLMLYLDFINLFLYLLRIFGDRE